MSPNEQVLPHVGFGLGVEVEGVGPAEVEAGGLDEGEDVGGDGTLAVVVLVVDGAPQGADEVVLDGTHGVLGHLVIEVLLESDIHAEGLAVAEIVARAVGHLVVVGADAAGDVQGGVDMAANEVAQAAVVLGTVVVEAVQVALGFLLE